MFHGIVYDVLAYPGWSVEEKRREIYRVIDALRYHPGDERVARKFETPQQHAKMMEQMMLKLTAGMQEGETPGSLMDAMHADAGDEDGAAVHAARRGRRG